MGGVGKRGWREVGKERVVRGEGIWAWKARGKRGRVMRATPLIIITVIIGVR